MSDFSYTLRKIRTEKGFLQKDIANAIGISVQAYSLYERGMREPTAETIEKIAEFFKVSPAYLMGWTVSDEKTGDIFYNSMKDDSEAQKPTTIAAHFDGDEYTEEELEQIRQFAEFVKSQRKDSE